MEPVANFVQKFKSARKEVEVNMREDTSGYGRFAAGSQEFADKLATDGWKNGKSNSTEYHGVPNGITQDDPADLDQPVTIRDGCLRCLNKMSRRQLVLIIVFIALLLDNMLLTSVVPIIPTYLYKIEHPNASLYKLPPLPPPPPPPPSHSAFAPTPPATSRRDKWSRRTTSAILRYASVTPAEGARWFPVEDDDEYHGGGKSTPRPGHADDAMHQSSSRARKLLRHAELANENVEVGLMFASKSITQMLINPIVGPLTNRIGYSIPMFTGFLVMFLSTLIFSFGTSYSVLFAARAIQGIGSACSSVAGLGMLATYYPDDEERGLAISRALGGLAVGVLIGPVFGGFMYEWVGKAVPFLLLAFLALFDGSLQLLVLKPAVRPECQQGAPLKQLLTDPYILIAAGSITFGNMGMAMLEPSLPLWMWVEMNAKEWQQGIAFLPCSVSYLIGTNVFGPIAHKIGRWRSGGIGMLIISVSLFFIPFATSIGHLVVPNFCLGFAIGMVDASMMPLMGYLVDLRHVSVYGSVYAIADIAFCVGFAVGPLLAGAIVKAIGFKWMLWCISALCLLYAPLHYFLRNPPGRKDDVGLIIGAQCPDDYSAEAAKKMCDEEDPHAQLYPNGEYAEIGQSPADSYYVDVTERPELSNNPFITSPTASKQLFMNSQQATDL